MLRRIGIGSIPLIVLATAVIGCSKADAPPAPASAAPPPPTAVATAATASAKPCPAPTTKGTGTSADPCMSAGATRMIQFTWTGKIGERPEFTMKNLSGRPIDNVSTNVYFYDKAGNIMTVQKGHSVPGWTGAYKLAANETKTLEMGPLKKDVPAGSTIEAEAQAVAFDTGEFGNDFYWANYDLSSYDRAKGGPK